MAGDVTLRGRLGRDPELRFTQTGKPVASLSVVTDRRQKDADGNWESVDTTWWRVTCWDQLAENVAETLTKGDAVIVVGMASLQEYEGKDGDTRQSLSVNAWTVGTDLRWLRRPERDKGNPGDKWDTPAPF